MELPGFGQVRVFQSDPCKCRPISTPIRRDCYVGVGKGWVFKAISTSKSSRLQTLFIENHEWPVTNPTVPSHSDCFYTSQLPHFLFQSTPSAADCYTPSNLLHSLAQHKRKLRHPEIVILPRIFSSPQTVCQIDSQMKLTVIKRSRVSAL